MDKPDFIGKSALQERFGRGQSKRLVTLKVDTKRAPAHAGASVMTDDEVIGTVTSGDWGHRVAMNLAYAFVRPELAGESQKLWIDMCGDRIRAEVIAPSPYDPEFTRVR
jgi:dimethylglycine dehydrogenase